MSEIAKHAECKKKLPADKTLIQKIFGIVPVDWSRYPDGSLVFISPTGQKFSYSKDMLDQELDRLRSKKIPAKKADPKKETKDKAAERQSRSMLKGSNAAPLCPPSLPPGECGSSPPPTRCSQE